VIGRVWTSGESLCPLSQRRLHIKVIERAGYAISALLNELGENHGVDQGEAITAANSLELVER